MQNGLGVRRGPASRNASSHPPCFKTACGRRIFVLPKALAHLQAHQDVLNPLPEAISRLEVPGNGFFEAEIEMGRVVGVAGIVTLPPLDAGSPMLFAQRNGRPYPSRVVPSDAARNTTTKVSIVAQPSRDIAGAHNLITAWVGNLARKEPWDVNLRTDFERSDSLAFWCAHALIHSPDTMGSIFESTWDAVLRGVRHVVVD